MEYIIASLILLVLTWYLFLEPLWAKLRTKKEDKGEKVLKRIVEIEERMKGQYQAQDALARAIDRTNSGIKEVNAASVKINSDLENLKLAVQDLDQRINAGVKVDDALERSIDKVALATIDAHQAISNRAQETRTMLMDRMDEFANHANDHCKRLDASLVEVREHIDQHLPRIEDSLTGQIHMLEERVTGLEVDLL